MNPAYLVSPVVAVLLLANAPSNAIAQNKVYGGIVVYDLKPGSEQAFVQLQQQQQMKHQAEATFVNDRVLACLDPLVSQYMTYAKFSNLAVTRAQTMQRVADARKLCRRDPEVHMAELTRAYLPQGHTTTPTGLEFGKGETGQMGHLGLFVPYPTSRSVYDDTLHEVKLLTANKNPQGYIGEDVLDETEAVAPEVQAPHSPRADTRAKMSINYGEYKTVEDAEDSYVARQQMKTPRMVVLERNFYSALQVPTRFYLFKVIGNWGKE